MLYECLQSDIRALDRVVEERSQQSAGLAQHQADVSRLKSKKHQYESESAALKVSKFGRCSSCCELFIAIRKIHSIQMN